MTSPQAPIVWELKDCWRDAEGEICFILFGDDNERATVYLTAHGDWSAWLDITDKPDFATERKLRSICARHIIDRAFGGKTS